MAIQHDRLWKKLTTGKVRRRITSHRISIQKIPCEFTHMTHTARTAHDVCVLYATKRRPHKYNNNHNIILLLHYLPPLFRAVVIRRRDDTRAFDEEESPATANITITSRPNTGIDKCRLQNIRITHSHRVEGEKYTCTYKYI